MDVNNLFKRTSFNFLIFHSSVFAFFVFITFIGNVFAKVFYDLKFFDSTIFQSFCLLMSFPLIIVFATLNFFLVEKIKKLLVPVFLPVFSILFLSFYLVLLFKFYSPENLLAYVEAVIFVGFSSFTTFGSISILLLIVLPYIILLRTENKETCSFELFGIKNRRIRYLLFINFCFYVLICTMNLIVSILKLF